MLRNAWVSTPVTAAQAATVTTMIGNIKNALANLPNLTPEDKQMCIKVGMAQLAMIDQVRTVCEQHPRVMPAYHDLTQYYATLDSVKFLLAIKELFDSGSAMVDAALMGAKDDAMRLTLDYYHSLSRAQSTAMPGLRPAYLRIRQNFIHETGQSPEDQFPEGGAGVAPQNGGGTGTDTQAI